MSGLLYWLGWPTRLPFLVDWPAWATLLAGAGAVTAAWKVGQRQADIAGRQASILEGQTRIQRAAHETVVFDRRIAFVNRIALAVQEASQLENTGELASEVWPLRFNARALFDRDVERKLSDLNNSLTTVHSYATMRNESMEDHDPRSADQHFERLQEAQAECYALYDEFLLLVDPYIKIGELG